MSMVKTVEELLNILVRELISAASNAANIRPLTPTEKIAILKNPIKKYSKGMPKTDEFKNFKVKNLSVSNIKVLRSSNP